MNDVITTRGLWAGSEAWAISEALESSHASDLAMLAMSDLFDAAWYLRAYPDVAEAGIDPATHFIVQGWQEGRRPNFYFDPIWYRATNPDVARASLNPVLHYIAAGEAEGRAPSEHFDLAWYASQHGPDPERTLLAHFLLRRQAGPASPLPEFDADYYLATYPDIAEAGVDPFEHYLLYGYREGRNPSASFDTAWYIARYLDGIADENPLIHYRRHRHAIRLHTARPADETNVFDEARRFARPGPDFEPFRPLPRGARRAAQVLAFYLPQFHPIAENDAWWGKGFTEWTSIGRAMPRFAGHYQPRIPGELGHYRLGADAPGRATMRRQAEMARDAGLAGFVHYFYWFNGHRLLETPTEAMLADPSIDFPFCLMWANENWTRRWDGSDDQVLIAQDYRAEDDDALVDCLARHFADPRYIRLNGRPLLMVYRAAAIPNAASRLARWRALFEARHGESPLWVMAQAFDAIDPRPFGFDAAVEFPPHKLVSRLPRRNAEARLFDTGMEGHIYDYADLAAASRAEPAPEFPLIRTAVPGWDNDARREGAGLVLRDATPAAYQAWLADLVARAGDERPLGAPLVCVNAWNEWAEGAYLEPDQHFGAAFLNATARAVTGGGLVPAERLLLVGHDAFQAGAQMLLLALLRSMKARFGLEAEYLLLGGGALASDYAGAGRGVVLADPGEDRLAALIAGFARRGFTGAIVNSLASARAVPLLRAAGLRVTLLVHELPGLIESRGWAAPAAAALAAADSVIFPARAVRDPVLAATGAAPASARILPQGLYRAEPAAADARRRLRAGLTQRGGILILGAGHGDLRKGFDLFLQAWRAARRLDATAVFAWAGDIEPAMRAFLRAEIEAAEATGSFRLLGHRDDVTDWFAAADAFALPSREDPYPSVVLEALAAGLPVVAFAGGGGAPEAIAALGRGETVALGDAEAMAAALLRLARRPGRPRRAPWATPAHFAAYAAALLADACPALPRIDVVVPNYNYAAHLPRRLGSIFAQTHPVRGVLLADDASDDDSVAIARATAGDWGRALDIEIAPANSGSPFTAWHRAAAGDGDFVWIAEADDEAEPGLLAALAGRLRAEPSAVFAFSDSRAIGPAGEALWPSYRPYAAEAGVDLGQDALFDARTALSNLLGERNLILNVSAVLWRREALAAALDRCGEALSRFKVAGDWRVYVEALADPAACVAYVARPLNRHRRHATGATARLDPRAHVAEIEAMHGLVLERVGDDAGLAARQAAYRDAVRREFRLASGKRRRRRPAGQLAS